MATWQGNENKGAGKLNETSNVKKNAVRDVALDYIRVIAMFMVVIDHIAFMRRDTWIVRRMFEFAVFRPLGIIQYFGAFGICIFFLLSGYLFLPSFNRRMPGICGEIRFTCRKLLGLWLPCVCAFAFFFVFQRVVGTITPLGRYWFQFSASDWIEAMTLTSFFIGSYDKINITWFLIPLVIFYAFYSHLQNMRIKEQCKPLILQGGVLVMYFLGKIFPSVPPFVALGHYSWCITLIIAGIILYQMKAGVFSRRLGVVFLAINYLVTLLGLYLYEKRYLGDEPYLISFIYALFLFVALPKLGLRQNKVVMFLADISFSVYLLHMTVGGLVMSLFENRIKYTFAVCVALLSCFLCGAILCYFVEKPIRKILCKL